MDNFSFFIFVVVAGFAELYNIQIHGECVCTTRTHTECKKIQWIHVYRINIAKQKKGATR